VPELMARHLEAFLAGMVLQPLLDTPGQASGGGERQSSTGIRNIESGE